MQRKRYISFYKEAERIKRLGRIAMASLLLAESIILPQFSNANDKTAETKAFKKQTSNTIKGRRDEDMVPKQGVQEKKEEKTTARKDIEAMINARNVPEAVEIYKKIIENRKNAEYDMEYKNAWKEISQDKKKEKKFTENFNSAKKYLEEETAKSQTITKTYEKKEELKPEDLNSLLKEKFPNVKEINLYISGSGQSGTESTAAVYDAYLEIIDKNENAVWYGLKGMKSDEYGITYEFVGKRVKDERSVKETEIWIKDGLAKLFGWEDAKIRFAQLMHSSIAANKNIYLFLSGKTGNYSYFETNREPNGSVTIGNVNGSPVNFNLIYEKIKTNEEFYKNIGQWEVLSKIGLINDINSITELIAKQMMVNTGELKVQIKVNDKSKTEIYRGGQIKIGEYSIIISAPIIEKTPEMKSPKIYFILYKIDADGNQIGSETIEANNDVKTNIGRKETIKNGKRIIEAEGKDFEIKVTPSKESLSGIISSLKNQTYILNIDGTSIPIVPSISNSYIYRTKDGEYQITLNDIRPIEPFLTSELYMQAEVTISNLKTNVAKSFLFNLGTNSVIKIDDKELNVKVEQPPYMSITNSLEYRDMRLNVNTIEMKNKNGEPYYVNEISYIGTIRSDLTSGKIQIGGKVITLSESPIKMRQKETPITRKEMEILAEKEAQVGALGTMTGFDIQNAIGFSFNANNSTGQGIWGVVYNPQPLIEKGLAGSGDALKQITIKTKRIGWNSLALTGLTAYEQEQLAKKDSDIDRIKDVTGFGLWLYLDALALHGEGRVISEKIAEEIKRNIEIGIKGERKEAIFQAFDPNREGFQILSIRYNTEEKAGEKDKNYVSIQKSDYRTSMGYRKNYEKDVIDSVYGRLDLYGIKNEQEEIMSGSSTTSEELARYTLKGWNPTIGIGTGKYGAWEVGFRMANADELNRIKAQSLSINASEIEELGYQIIAKGIPLFGKYEVDARFNKTNWERTTKKNDILSMFSSGQNQILEIQPVAKLDKDTYAYLSVTTELTANQMKDILSGSETRTKTRKTELRPGYKNRWIELNVFWITNSQETFTKTSTKLEKMRNQQKQLGLNIFGKATKDVNFNLSYSQTWDKYGTTWMISSGIRLRFGQGK